MKHPAKLLVAFLLFWTTAAMADDKLLYLPVQIKYTDKKTGKELTLNGDLYFEAFPILIDGKKATIGKSKLIPTSRNPASMTRMEDGKFLIKIDWGDKVAQFDFTAIPLKLSDSKELSAALDKGFMPETTAELEGTGSKTAKPAPPPVVLGLAQAPAFNEIPVSQIQSIQFKPVSTVNMELGGRYMAFVKRVKGSNGAIRLDAATFFGGAADEKFVGGAFLKDGGIVAAANVTDLGFTGNVAQSVLGKETDPPGDSSARPLTGALVKYSDDLRSLVAIARFPWGAGQAAQLIQGPSGALYMLCSGGPAIKAITDNARSQTIANPDAKAGLAAHEGSLLLCLSPELKLQWVMFFQHRNVGCWLRPGEELLVHSQGQYWIIDREGKMQDGPQLKTNITNPRRGPQAVSPYDGAFYIGGDYNSGTGFEPYRNPYLHKITPDGVCRWTAWNWTGPVVGTYFRQVSDSSPRGVRFCRNGDILVIGWSDGGNTVFCNQPYDLEKYHGKYTFFNDMSAAGVGSFCHLLRMDARTMEVKAGTMWMSYLPYAQKNGQPNSAAARDVVELDDGRFALAGGTAYATIETPDAWVRPFILDYQKDPLTAKPKAGPTFAMFDADFRNMLFCSITPAVRDQKLIVRGKQVLLVGSVGEKDPGYGVEMTPLLANPIQKEFGGGKSDAYIMLIDTASK